MKTIPVITLAASLLLVVGLPVSISAKSATSETQATTASPTDMTDGEVKKINKETGKITLKHGEIKKLGMPSMTMVFTVKDKSLLDKVQPGDKVKFRAISDNGKLTVTDVQPVK